MFFKKKPDRSSLELTVIKQKIAEFTVDNHKIDDWIQDCQLTGTTLTLKMRIPEHIDVERVHAVLGEYLYQHGVQTLDMEVALVKTSGNDKNSHDKSNHDKNSGVQSFDPNHHTPSSHSSTQDKSKAQDVLAPHPRIRHIIAVASGKGGVGKSTVSVNLALALHALGHKVGLLDADIYGPSLPDMLGVAGQKPMVENDEFVPIDAYGLPMISIGSLIDSDSTPVAWRGIKATGALMQLYNQTAFPHLDYLIIDMPPGTGDIQLSLAQRIPITASIVVTTPQHIALLDAKKGVELFKKTHIPILGVVENMSVHICSACGHSETIFGECGGDELAESADAPLLARLPLAKGIREQMDKGVPSMIANDGKGDEYAPFYRQLAKQVDERIGQFAKVRDDNRIF